MGDCGMNIDDFFPITRPEIGVPEVLQSLVPDAKWIVPNNDYTKVQWVYIPPGVTTPTLEEVDAELKRLQEEHERNKYQRLRVKGYPSIEEQLDILYHEGYDGWKSKIDRIKRRYPKHSTNN
jgi:hypothetical protein